MPTRTYLVTGAAGQLGQALGIEPPRGCDVIMANRQALDITHQQSVFEFFATHELAGVINAAAYTAVDKAESEPKLAAAINTAGVHNLGVAAREYDIPLIHVSTDFVFSGDKSSPYKPEDERNPKSVYGKTKADGEDTLTAIAGLKSTIIRTAWVYNSEGANFVTTMLRLMAEKESLNIVADQVGTPTNVTGLAKACWFFMQSEESGTFHWSDAGVASWYDFAVAIQEIATDAGLLEAIIPLFPIPTSMYPTPAARPHYSVLDKASSWDIMDCKPLHWRGELKKTLLQIHSNST